MKKAGLAIVLILGGLIAFGGRRLADDSRRIHQDLKSSIAAPVKGPTAEVAQPSTSRAPATVERKNRRASVIEEVRSSIHALNACYESGCGLGESDPKGAYFEIGRRIGTQLNRLTETVLSEHLIDPAISEIAREALGNSDGHVKVGALDLIATQPVSSENLTAILNGVILDSDPELIEQALLELDRYDRSGEKDQVNQALKESLLHGSPFVALRIAEQIDTVLNRRNARFFAEIAAELDNDSRVKTELLRALSTL